MIQTSLAPLFASSCLFIFSQRCQTIEETKYTKEPQLFSNRPPRPPMINEARTPLRGLLYKGKVYPFPFPVARFSASFSKSTRTELGRRLPETGVRREYAAAALTLVRGGQVRGGEATLGHHWYRTSGAPALCPSKSDVVANGRLPLASDSSDSHNFHDSHDPQTSQIPHPSAFVA
ncbi:hypothetical protein B0H66DRAFT_89935 [Apodospora peruviana]|uniref:Secreted protein n=1 Tax=Apodospora peruviana TaxID=516989 RepID=A0AAE0IUD5_9PEZI|nr:hypothetical protein B0H66DRAFT_89935 [Apodospora peruviana]